MKEDEKVGEIEIPIAPEELTDEEKKEWLLTTVFPGVSAESLRAFFKKNSDCYHHVASYFERMADEKNNFLLPLLLAYIKDYDEVYKIYGDKHDRLACVRELVFKKDNSFIHISGNLSSNSYQVRHFFADNQYEKSDLMIEPTSITIVSHKVDERDTGIVVEETYKLFKENETYHKYIGCQPFKHPSVELDGNGDDSLRSQFISPVLSYVNSERHVYSREMIIQSCDEYNAENYGEISYPGLNYEGLINRTINLQCEDNDTKVVPEVINSILINKEEDSKKPIVVKINGKNVSREYEDIKSIAKIYHKYLTEELPKVKTQEDSLLVSFKDSLEEEQMVLKKKPE